MATRAPAISINYQVNVNDRGTRQLLQADRRIRQSAQQTANAANQSSRAQTRAAGQATRASQRQATQQRRLATVAVASGAKMRASMLGAAKGIAAPVAALATLGGSLAFLKSSVKATTDMFVATRRLQGTTQMDTRTASQWVAMMKVRGIEGNKLSIMFKSLAKNQSDAARGSKAATDAFKNLGISQKQVQNLRSDQLILRVADAFKTGAIPAYRQAAIASRLFGRQGTMLIPLLRGGSKAIKDQLRDVRAYGAFMEGKGAKSIGEYLAQQRRAKLATLGLQLAIGQKLIPWLSKGARNINEMASGFRNSGLAADGTKTKASEFGAKLKVIAEDIGRFIEKVKIAVDWLIKFRDGFKDVIDVATAGGGFADLVRMMQGAPAYDLPKPKPPKPDQPGRHTGPAAHQRRGGWINSFARGGAVPGLVSPGEAIMSPSGAMVQVPGSPTASDSVMTMLPVGGAVFTRSGQAALARGATPEQALATQIPQFATGGKVYSLRDLVALSKGVSMAKPATAASVAMAESTGRTDANLATSREDSRGLWQINTFAHRWADKQRLYEPVYNARAAYKVSDGGKNWGPWSVYPGRSQKYMKQAEALSRTVPASLVGGGGSSATGAPGTSYEKTTWKLGPGADPNQFLAGFQAGQAGQTLAASGALEEIIGATIAERNTQTISVPGTLSPESLRPGPPGWAGSAAFLSRAAKVGTQLGGKITSRKRSSDPSGIGTASDHHTGNRVAYALDFFGIYGDKAMKVAQGLAATYGIPKGYIGTFNRHTSTWRGKKFSTQLLYNVKNHAPGDNEHVHIGARAARKGGWVGRFRTGGGIPGRIGTGYSGPQPGDPTGFMLGPGPNAPIPYRRPTAPHEYPTGTGTAGPVIADIAAQVRAVVGLSLKATGMAVGAALRALAEGVATVPYAAVRSQAKQLAARLQKLEAVKAPTAEQKTELNRVRGALGVLHAEIGRRIGETLEQSTQRIEKIERELGHFQQEQVLSGVDTESERGQQQLAEYHESLVEQLRTERERVISEAQDRLKDVTDPSQRAEIQRSVEQQVIAVDERMRQAVMDQAQALAAAVQAQIQAFQEELQRRQTQFDARLAIRAIDPSSVRGLTAQEKFLKSQRDMMEDQRSKLEDQLQSASGPTAVAIRSQLKSLSDEILTVTGQIVQAHIAAIRAEAQERVDKARHKSTMRGMGLERLETTQRLQRRFEFGAFERANYIQSQILPGIDKELAALQKQLKVARSDPKKGGDKALARQVAEEIYKLENEREQRKLEVMELVESNTAGLRELTGTIAFEALGGQFTDALGVGTGA